MASKTVTVVLSGPLLSSLFYNHSSSSSDQEGFLIGEEVNRITDAFNDSQICENEETFLNIESFVSCPAKQFSFYDNSYKIDNEQLSNLLTTNLKRVIGWYKFRRNTTTIMSFLEDKIHKNLSLAYPDNPNFIFALFTSNPISKATHDAQHVFLRKNHRSVFEPLRLKVINLHMNDETSQYRSFNTNRMTGIFNEIVNKLVKPAENKVLMASQILEAMQLNLNKLQKRLADREEEASKLDKEIKLLELSLKQ